MTLVHNLAVYRASLGRLSRWFQARREIGPLRAKILIVLLTIVAVVALWSLVIQQLSLVRAQAVSTAVRQNEMRTEAFQQYVIRTLDVANLALNHTITTHAKVLSAASAKLIFLDDHTLDSPAFAAITIQNGNRVVASTRTTAPALPESEVLRANKPTFTVNRPMWSPEERKNLVSISRSFNHEGRSGVASVWIEPRSFTDISDRQAFSANDLISLVGLDGITRARRTGNQLSSGEDLSGKLVMKMQALKPNGTYLGPSSIDQIPRYFTHRRLVGHPLFVTSGIAAADVLAATKKQEKLYVAGLARHHSCPLIWLLDTRRRYRTTLSSSCALGRR